MATSEKEIKYKGKVITIKVPSGMYEFYSDVEKRFLKFDSLSGAKSSIDKESSKPKSKLKESKDDLIDLTIPQHYASAIINNDYSGLSDEDESILNDFINRIKNQYGNANFMLGDEEDMDIGFMHKSDVDNMGAEMMKLYIKPNTPMSEDFDQRPNSNPDFIEIETPINSKDFKIFSAIVKSGGFKKSQFGTRNYDSIGKRGYFNFSKLEKDILLKKLNKLYEKYNDEDIITWISDIEDYDNLAESEDPCWKGYKQFGTKKKKDKEVPNCVPVNESKKVQKIKLSELRSLIKKVINESKNK